MSCLEELWTNKNVRIPSSVTKLEFFWNFFYFNFYHLKGLNAMKALVLNGVLIADDQLEHESASVHRGVSELQLVKTDFLGVFSSNVSFFELKVLHLDPSKNYTSLGLLRVAPNLERLELVIAQLDVLP
jgi:hypothetical protein